MHAAPFFAILGTAAGKQILDSLPQEMIAAANRVLRRSLNYAMNYCPRRWRISAISGSS